MKRFVFVLSLLMFTGFELLYGQDIQVTGNVTSADDGVELPGVSVVVQGTTLGSVTDFQGNYTITVPGADLILIFSFIGMSTQEVPVYGRLTIDVVLESSSIEIEEVVAIGYGSVRKKDLTSSISTVQGADIIKSAPGNFAKGLQGLAAGVQVFDTDGRPGSSPTIVIRGATSMSGNTNPIIVIDGIPVGFNANQLNPEDIESVSILKDASATAIYGTQAANGVMLVTTKKGRMGESNFKVSANYGLQQLKNPGVAGAEEYMEIQNLKRFNERPDRGEFQLFSEEEVANAVGTDWWNEAIRPLAPRYNMNIGFDGGSKKLRYSGNVGYFGQESQMEVGNWDKVTARFNTEYHFSDNVKFGQNFYPRFESWTNTPDIWSLISMDPTTPVYIPEDEQEGKNRYSIYQRSFNNDTYNPMGMIERYKVNNNNLLIGMQTNTCQRPELAESLSQSFQGDQFTINVPPM